MTIAMMIEMLAGKSGAIHGLVHDATPFKFSEDDDAIDHFAKQLVRFGASLISKLIGNQFIADNYN